VEHFLGNKDDQKKAMDAFQAADADDIMMDSDLEDLVSCLDEEDANQLDLKELKDKKRKKRYQKKSAMDSKVPDRNKRQKGKGRGKGRGKGKGRGRAARPRLPKAFAKKQKKEHQESQEPPSPKPGDAPILQPESPVLSPSSPLPDKSEMAAEPESLPGAEDVPASFAQPVLADCPSSSSAAAPSSHAPSGDARQAPPEQPKGIPRPKIYSTPIEVLEKMLPQGAKIVLSHDEHRFLTTWVGTSEGIPLDLKGKYFPDPSMPTNLGSRPFLNVTTDCGKSGLLWLPSTLFQQGWHPRNLGRCQRMCF